MDKLFLMTVLRVLALRLAILARKGGGPPLFIGLSEVLAKLSGKNQSKMSIFTFSRGYPGVLTKFGQIY